MKTMARCGGRGKMQMRASWAALRGFGLFLAGLLVGSLISISKADGPGAWGAYEVRQVIQLLQQIAVNTK